MEMFTSTVFAQELSSKDLIPEKLWDRITRRIMKDCHFDKEMAEVILDGTLCFLKMCGDYPNRSFSPSKLIDIGWHMFLLYTRGYQEFCNRVNGGFIHHEPNDGENMDLKKDGVQSVVQFMRENDISFHKKLWLGKMSLCDGNRCTVDCKNDCSPGPCHDLSLLK